VVVGWYVTYWAEKDSNTVSKFDWKILLSYILVLLCGVLIGYDITASGNSYTNLPAWLSAIGTLSAVVVALYTSKVNIDRDKYKLKCTSCFYYKPTFIENSDGFVTESAKPLHMLSVRVVNIGLRPISIECLIVKGKTRAIALYDITKTPGPNGLPIHTKINPGDFSVWEVSEEYYKPIWKNDELIEVFVVDAVGIRHKTVSVDTPFLM
tara:strand:- start:940 stop:1566 length:627 start_codon:yes stop_codon:yes gene_type:complete